MKIKNYRVGYSLIELLVVITLIGILGTVSSEVFILGIKLQQKSEIIKEVKQNGDYVNSVLDANIRNAVDVIEPSCSQPLASSFIKFTGGDGKTIKLSCEDEDLGGGKTYEYMALITNPDFLPTVAPLTNKKVKVIQSSCKFRLICPTPAIAPKYVLVNYTITQTISGDIPLEQKASVDYQSVITLRKYE